MDKVLIPNPPNPYEFYKYLTLSYKESHYSNNGPCVRLLEDRLQSFLLSSEKPVLMCNATAALTVVLQAFNLQNQDVLIPSFTFSATGHSVINAGCNPVLVDIDDDLFMSLRDAELKITEKTKAIIVVHALGYICDYKKYENFTAKHNLILIFDAAATLGFKYPDGLMIGNAGDCEVFSLHITKTFGIGEGGLISSGNKNLLERCRKMSNFGFDENSYSTEVGYNTKCSDFHAAVGLSVLDKIDEIITNKKTKFDYFCNRLPQAINKPCGYQIFPILLNSKEQRHKLIERFKEKNIGYRIYYTPLHVQPYFFSINETMPKTDDIFSRIMCIPFYETLKIEDMDTIIETVSLSVQR